MSDRPDVTRGRGAVRNLPNRFERFQVDLASGDDGWPGEDDPSRAPSPRTVFFKDHARSALTHNKSPDIPFETSLNPYRGCEHGCAYCYARPTHEYLGFSAGLDFETKILVKEDAPELLRRELASPSWRPRHVSLSGVTDPYQPAERHLRLTRRCLEVLAEFRNPVSVVTKNHLVTRDADLLAALAAHEAAAVFVSVTTLDPALSGTLEPRTSRPSYRLEAVRRLNEAGVPAGVLVAPVVPGLTDEELPRILTAAAEAGARYAGFVPLRLPSSVLTVFTEWLDAHRPDRKEKILSRLRSLRGGRLNDPRFGSRMQGDGPFAASIASLFSLTCRRLGLDTEGPRLSTAAFRRPGEQLSLL